MEVPRPKHDSGWGLRSSLRQALVDCFARKFDGGGGGGFLFLYGKERRGLGERVCLRRRRRVRGGAELISMRVRAKFARRKLKNNIKYIVPV